MPGDFDHAASGSEIAPEDDEPARRLQWRLDRHDHILSRRFNRLGGLLGDRPAGHGHLAAVQLAGIEQSLREQLCPACPVHVERHITASRTEVADQRGTLTDLVEVVDIQLDPGLPGDRHQV